MAFTLYRQMDSMDCGPSCLRMVARHYGKHISASILREMTGIGRTGVNLLGISEAAENIGFRTRPVRCTTETLRTEAPLPVILHWDKDHFVVLYKTGRRKWQIADPAEGLVSYKTKEFQEHWLGLRDAEEGGQGIALLMEPTPRFYQYEDHPEDTRGRMGSLMHYIAPYRNLLLQVLLGLIIASLLQLGFPFLTQSLVDVGVNTANLHFVYVVLLAQAALLAGRLVVELVRGWILLHISTRVNISILTNFLQKLMKLPVSFFDSRHTGDILQRMNDHQRIESFLTGSSLNMVFSLLSLSVFSLVLLLFNTKIFVVFILASLIYAGWVLLFWHKSKTLDYKRFETSSREQGATIQLIHGMQEIKVQGCERPMRWNWEQWQVKLFRLNVKSLALNQWRQSGAFFLNEGKNILITFLSAGAVIKGEITLGSMLAIQYIIGQMNGPVEQMISFIQSWQYARLSMDRLNEIHSLEDEEPQGKPLFHELPPIFRKRITGGRMGTHYAGTWYFQDGAGNPDAGSQDGYEREADPPVNRSWNTEEPDGIIFRGVSFTYPGAGNATVLRNINLLIPAGKTTAIVGLSGSGKTTLLKLLLKFYEPQKGEIRLGNTAFSTLSHSAWRKHCGVVMQDSFIFSDTIAKNIATGEEPVDRTRLEEALVVANIQSFIDELPMGVHTKIGAEGMGISMGQRQRILIARAVYRDPQFILFDEATNSLDADNESRIMQNLHTFFKNRTVIVVAHRLSTVREADQIVVLHGGEISERGTHEALIRLKGEYFNLVRNQLEIGK